MSTASPSRITASRTQDGRLALYIFLAGVLSLPWIAFRIGAVTLSDALFALSALVVLLQTRSPRPSAPMQVALGLSILAVCVASLSAVDPVESLLVGARVVYIFAIWQWVTRALVDTPHALRLAVGAFVLGCAVSGAAGIAQVALDIDIPNSTVVFGRAAGLQTHPNGQGGALAIGLAAAFALASTRATRGIGIAGAVAITAGLVVSGSVSGMLAATIGGIVVMLRVKPTAAWWAMLTGAAGIAWLVVSRIDLFVPNAVSPVTRLLDTTGRGTGESTAYTRWLTVEHAWEQIAERGVAGVGLDVASGVTYDGETAAHNILILALFQGGLILLLALVCAIGAGVAALRTPFPGDPVSRIALPAMLATSLAFALTGPVLYERWFWLPVLLALAVGTAQTNRPSDAAADGSSSP